MGLYVEVAGDKTAWIQANGTALSHREAETAIQQYPDSLPVVWLQQGYIALGVGFNQREVERFLTGRPDGKWFLVKKAILREHVPGAKKDRHFQDGEA